MTWRRMPLIAALLLGACVSGGKPSEVPPLTPPAAWRGNADAQRDPVDARWWSSFGDPVLAQLVERAIANNPDVAIAAGRVREARANVALARSQLLPTLDAGAAGGHSRTVSAFGTPLNQEFLQPQVVAGYEVDLFGRLADSTEAARQAYLASEAAHGSVRLAIASAVASQYIALLGLDARLQVARDTLAARSESLRIAQSRDRAGYSPKLELQQARAEYDATAQIIPQIEGAIRRTEDGLSQLTGEPPHEIERGGALRSLAVPPVPAGLPSDLLDRRPDIAQAADQLAATDAALRAARKRFLPQLRLSASGGLAISSLLADPITLWQAGGSVLAPLFAGGRLRAGVEAAAGQRDQAAFAYRRTVLQSLREVEDALAAIGAVDAQIALARHQRDTVAEALRLATNRYRAGYSSYLEQLDAQRGLLNADLALVSLQTDALTARVQLFQALGGGWR
ncbi:RND transporter NodT [Novosphingobium sediminis]|uniref:RND transporter NodT n=1 Tax=Novosphingobium sediminis TaxID=707214 RepID=A0A512AG54_9SPHN|nr:efflux transporter outer membrane subunit [Novosphingobium sediminis]GEN98688.1 RND transporter NodT [Novosphingobium sediminis]